MSSYVPWDIQEMVLKGLPTRSLVRFRMVSQGWKHTIESSEFIADYRGSETQMIVSPSQTVQNFVLIRVDETFPRTSFPLPLPPVPEIAENCLPHVVGVCNGLVCLQGWRPEPPGCAIAKHDLLGKLVAVLWNPCIRKSKVIRVPKLSNRPFQTVIGLGLHPHNFDPRLVKIDYVPATCTRWKIQVYSMCSGMWKDIARQRVCSQIVLTSYQTAIDGHIYFLASRHAFRVEPLSMLIDFDLTTQKYSEVLFPDALARSDITAVGLSQVNGDPVVIQEPELMLYSVWQMDRHPPQSFTKIYNIPAPDATIHRLLGFRPPAGLVFLANTAFDENNVVLHDLNDPKCPEITQTFQAR